MSPSLWERSQHINLHTPSVCTVWVQHLLRQPAPSHLVKQTEWDTHSGYDALRHRQAAPPHNRHTCPANAHAHMRHAYGSSQAHTHLEEGKYAQCNHADGGRIASHKQQEGGLDELLMSGPPLQHVLRGQVRDQVITGLLHLALHLSGREQVSRSHKAQRLGRVQAAGKPAQEHDSTIACTFK